jgi:hypothetical protein
MTRPAEIIKFVRAELKKRGFDVRVTCTAAQWPGVYFVTVWFMYAWAGVVWSDETFPTQSINLLENSLNRFIARIWDDAA